jgi:hypothetical protein
MKKTPLLVLLAVVVASASAQRIPWIHHDNLPAGSAALRAMVAATNGSEGTPAGSCESSGSDSQNMQLANQVIDMHILRDQMQALELDRETELAMAPRGKQQGNMKRVSDIRRRYDERLRAKTSLMAIEVAHSQTSLQMAGVRSGCIQTAREVEGR